VDLVGFKIIGIPEKAESGCLETDPCVKKIYYFEKEDKVYVISTYVVNVNSFNEYEDYKNLLNQVFSTFRFIN
jgi:hypothetical protein